MRNKRFAAHEYLLSHDQAESDCFNTRGSVLIEFKAGLIQALSEIFPINADMVVLPEVKFPTWLIADGFILISCIAAFDDRHHRD